MAGATETESPGRAPAAVLPPPFTEPRAPGETGRFKFSGFGAFSYVTQERGFNTQEGDARALSGFNIEDAAIYMNYEQDRMSVIADLAIRRATDRDSNRDRQTGNMSEASSNDLAIGKDRSQLYLKYRLNKDLVLDAGQFDTIFGVELNDAKDRVFNKTGLVYDNIAPVTHTGAMLEYAHGVMLARGFAANPNNQGSYANSPASGQNTEYGATLGLQNEQLHVQAGYMSRSVATANGSGRGARSLADFVVGTHLGSWLLDLEYATVNDPSKNAQTSGNLNDSEAAMSGFLALTSYRLNGAWLVGARYETIQNPSIQDVKAIQGAGLSLHYQVAPELELRTEYVNSWWKNINTDNASGGRFEISTLFSF